MGSHGLGPRVVGLRVVVRYLLDSGSATDVLGVCLSWGDGRCVVQPATGPPVSIRLSDIVSGKPVPPRASIRDRVSPREAQHHGFALFPDLVTEPVGDWVLRGSPTATARRANSVLAFGPSGVGDDVERVVAHYDRPVAAVLTGSLENQRFEALGWVPESDDSDTLFQVAGLAQVARALRGVPVPDTAVLTPAPTGGFAALRLGDKAWGYAGFDDDWLGFSGIEVHPSHRRRGLGRQVMAALLGWGAELGATTAYLQVLADNTAALALYEDLGFRTHHTYRYLTPSTGRRLSRASH